MAHIADITGGRRARRDSFVDALAADAALGSVVGVEVKPLSVVATTRDSHAAHAVALLAGRKAAYHQTREPEPGRFVITVRF